MAEHVSNEAAIATATARRFGGQSMTATLRSVLLRRPARPATGEEWRDFGYVHPVDPELAEREHAALRELLTGANVEVIEDGPDPDGLLDAVFAFDPSYITDHGAIILRPGKALRQAEAALTARTYERIGVPILGWIKEPGTVEGGDCFWIDARTLAVGRGYRTNGEGIRQLREILAGIDVDLFAYDLPHWHGPGACLHLLSLISPVAADLAVIYRSLMPVRLVETLEERGWRFVDLPDEEFASMGGNVLALGPGQCLMLDGNPETRRRLEAAGCEVRIYQGQEISLNREGGPTCLTRPLWREIVATA
ncbi:MAG: dimethylarginine dimethylaminohydrolase family protein [Thermomicrobiales bacterium]